MTEELRYEYALERQLKALIQQLEKSGYAIRDEILKFHNQQCPRCRTTFKMYGNEIKGGGSISVFIPDNRPKDAFIYCPCKPCTREIIKAQFVRVFSDPKGAAIQAYINEKLECSEK